MDLPAELKNYIENQTFNIKNETLINSRKSLTDKYKNKSGKGLNLIDSDNDASVYSIVRMPATFGSVYSALKYTLENIDSTFSSLIDVGAGTGAASWAAYSLINLEKITCLEREDKMRNLGSKIMKTGPNILNNANWIKYDITKDSLKEKGDIVITSYMLNELSEDFRIKAIDKLYDMTNNLLLIVEPGTPQGFKNIKMAREYLLKEGAHIIAPCPSNNTCQIEDSDWCHFSCRIQRSKLHRILKKGDAPYEDEKFSYIAVSKNDFKLKPYSRILRHPIIKKGHISLQICTDNNKVENLSLTKKDGSLYKSSKKLKWGDSLFK
ncbi:small ribosomal subunit Rsm22 family protein [Clostridium sp. BJN0001]|uniref:small ribosomal subunit Rsm22 family protein n=1 Tax=Clostridium sp. BJN0001 TaxID=2930219 RepID=UPI001FD478B0|nr:small ribosomal subunit Rsm22 family protein [Clostridium sp. BJN0001]